MGAESGLGGLYRGCGNSSNGLTQAVQSPHSRLHSVWSSIVTLSLLIAFALSQAAR